MLTTIFPLIAFIFLNIESDEDVFDDKSDDDGSGYGSTIESESSLYGSCPFYFSKIPLIVFVYCHIMESQNPFVVSWDFISLNIFQLKNLSSFKFRILNMNFMLSPCPLFQNHG